MNNRSRNRFRALRKLSRSNLIYALNRRRVRYVPKRIYKNGAGAAFLVFDLLVYLQEEV